MWEGNAMKKKIISIVAMFLASSLLFCVVLLAALPKGKYLEKISLNIDTRISEKYTNMDIYSESFEERNISIDKNEKDGYTYTFKENSVCYLKKMNGALTVAISNAQDGSRTEYKASIKTFYPFKALSLIEIYNDNITVSYKYNFWCWYLLLEIPTVGIFTLITITKKRKSKCDYAIL